MGYIFEGVGVALATPFTHNEADYEVIRRHTDYLIDNDTKSIVVNDNNIEKPTLTDDEIDQVLEIIITHVVGYFFVYNTH